ncbi:MAG: two-component regulator propeller domain-containing protein [Paludibacter sp.]|nr:two-component regulator propeller domain-containing protein [Paludibacter sp.]
MRRFYFLILGVFFSVSAYTDVSIEQYKDIQYRTLTSKNGLTQMTVLDIIQDNKGYLWFATRDGINRFDGNQIISYKNLIGEEKSLSSNYTTSFAIDRDNRLWVGTHYGLNAYDYVNETFDSFYYNDPEKLNDYNRIRKIIIDSENRIWVATKGGLLYFDSDEKKLVKCTSISAPVLSICEYEKKILVSYEFGGLYLFDTNTREKTPINIKGTDKKTVFRSIYYAKNEDVYLGSDGQGLYKLNKDLSFNKHFINESNNPLSLSNNTIRSITEDQDGNIIVATFDGISFYSPERDYFVRVKSQSGEDDRFSHFSFHSIFIDNSGTLWGGTWAGGVSYGNPNWEGNSFKVLNPYPQKRQLGIIGPLITEKDGIWIGIEGSGFVFYNHEKKTYKHFKLPDANGGNFRTNIVTAFGKDIHNLYVGTNNGNIAVFDRKSERIKQIFRVPGERSVMSLCAVGDGSFLVGTTGEKSLIKFDRDGLMTDEFYDRKGRRFDFEFVRSIEKIVDNEFIILERKYGYYRLNLETNDIQFIDLAAYSNSPNDAINCLYKDRNSQLWFGTYENGLYRIDLQGNLLNHFIYPDHLNSNTINAITGDEKGNIWFSQQNNLTQIDIVTLKIKNYTSFDINEFSLRSALYANGLMFFGGDKGLVTFDPSNLNKRSAVPPLVINKLTVNNITVRPAEIDFRNEEFKLSYNQSNIIIDYTALEYFSPKEINYAYMLEGFDKNWNYVENNLRAYYTNLPPGKYRFLLKASFNDEVWSNEMVMMDFSVTPPLWKTWWAYLIYVIVFLTIVSVFIHYLKVELRLKNDIILQKEKQMNMEKLHDDRMMLFTNLSHELRTPLSLIIGPLESLLSDSKLAGRAQSSLELILKNARRLLFIANELLDFRKKESSNLELKVAAGNFSLFVYEILLSFSQLADQHKIELIYEGKDDGIHLWYDRFWMEKVLFNLLSNAFKNTPDYGKIEILSQIKNSNYILTIKDSGKGIPDNQLDVIFEPFHQVRNSENYSNGTGIGLSLVKGIIELHSGVVKAENNTDVGANFTIYLPLGRSHFSDQQIIENYKSSEEISQYAYIDDEDSIAKIISLDKGNKKSVLVIEDNKDLRNYLQQILQKYYHVFTASNGVDGLALAMNNIPDMVLSDIMMPKMDGIELCRRLKNSDKTSHIPVVLLTARASIAHVQEGLNIGADDYFIKPFNPVILISKIENILNSRDNLKKYYSKTFGEEILKHAVTNVDKDFVNKLYYTIESNISNPDFSTDILGKKIGMSKTGLYNKVKEFAGCAPSELIKKTRMEMAVKLLSEGETPVAEIAVNLGFRSNSYFSSCFKSTHNMTPTEYVKNFKK